MYLFYYYFYFATLVEKLNFIIINYPKLTLSPTRYFTFPVSNVIYNFWKKNLCKYS